jgi:hypothetical protein
VLCADVRGFVRTVEGIKTSFVKPGRVIVSDLGAVMCAQWSSVLRHRLYTMCE